MSTTANKLFDDEDGDFVETKQCSKCHEIKPIDEFSNNANTRDRHHYACKICDNARVAQHYQNNSEKINERDRKHYKKFTHRYDAKRKVNDAITKGELVRPEICEKCGNTNGSIIIEAHHFDYSKPLNVVWWCKSCHIAWHRKNDISTLDTEVI